MLGRRLAAPWRAGSLHLRVPGGSRTNQTDVPASLHPPAIPRGSNSALQILRFYLGSGSDPTPIPGAHTAAGSVRSIRTDQALVRGVSLSWTKALSREQAPLSLQKAQEEHATYVEVLRRCVDTVVEIPADPKLPDCCFIEDCAVSIGRTVLLTNPGAASRRPEPPALSAPIRALPGAPRTLVSMLEMDSSATLDGGDVLHTERHVFVGLSSRTNAAGVEALRAALAPELPGGARSVFAIEVIGDLHLKSLATYAGNHQMAVDDSPGGRHLAQEVDRLTGVSGGYAWHVMSTHAATNLLRVNDFLIMQEGVKRLPEIGKLLDAAHVRPENAFEVPNQEFSKADGAVTCRSVLIQHLSHFRK